MDSLFQPIVSNAVGRLLQLARGFALIAPHFTRHFVELLFEVIHLCLELILTLGVLGRTLGASTARLRQRHRLLRQLTVLARDLVGLLLRVLHIPLSARALFLLEAPLRFAELAERRARLTGGARVSRRCRTPHRIGGLPHLLSGLRQVRTITLSRQPLELASGFLSLFGERALAGAASLADLPRKRLLTLTLRFLLLPSRELAQLLHQRVELLIGLLLLCALRCFVLIRELVEILLEQLRKIFRHGSGAAAATSASTALLAHLLLVFFFGLLKLLQRAVLRGQGVGRRLRLKLPFGSAHLLCGFRQQLGNPLERGIGLYQPAVHAGYETLDLLAKFGL